MKKYLILIALVGFMGISITRLYSLTAPQVSFDIDKIEQNMKANPYHYFSIKILFDKLAERYRTLIKQYTSATNPGARKNLVDDINRVRADILNLLAKTN